MDNDLSPYSLKHSEKQKEREKDVHYMRFTLWRFWLWVMLTRVRCHFCKTWITQLRWQTAVGPCSLVKDHRKCRRAAVSTSITPSYCSTREGLHFFFFWSWITLARPSRQNWGLSAYSESSHFFREVVVVSVHRCFAPSSGHLYIALVYVQHTSLQVCMPDINQCNMELTTRGSEARGTEIHRKETGT